MTTTTDTRTAKTDISKFEFTHFSNEQLDFDATRYYSSPRGVVSKPGGFWVSVETPGMEGWKKRVQDDTRMTCFHTLAYSSDVTLCEPDKILVIDSSDALLSLVDEYGEPGFDGEVTMTVDSWAYLRWDSGYAGILFIGEGRVPCDDRTWWVREMECDSGAIWHLDAISVSESRPTGLEVKMCHCSYTCECE